MFKLTSKKKKKKNAGTLTSITAFIIKNYQSSKWVDLELFVLTNRFKLEDYQHSILDFVYYTYFELNIPTKN